MSRGAGTDARRADAQLGPRLLALWGGHAWQDANREARCELLIARGAAPVGDGLFPAAVFEQLGEQKLKAAAMTGTAGPEA